MLVSLLLLLALLCTAALADRYTFGAFSVELPEGTLYQAYELEHTQPVMVLYPNYDANAVTHSSISAVWLADYYNLSLYDPIDYAIGVLDGTKESYESMGVGIDRIALTNAERTTVDGQPAICLTYRCDLDFRPIGINANQTFYGLSLTVSMQDLGIYSYTILAHSQAELVEFANILDTIVWDRET